MKHALLDSPIQGANGPANCSFGFGWFTIGDGSTGAVKHGSSGATDTLVSAVTAKGLTGCFSGGQLIFSLYLFCDGLWNNHYYKGPSVAVKTLTC